MKLTAEQKQLFHECVDLAFDIEVKGFRFESNVVPTDVYLGVYRKKTNEAINTVANYDKHGLQQAKDLLTKILEK